MLKEEVVEMGKLVFYGAISLDGFLARKNHSLDWLFESETDVDSGYGTFYETVEAIVMGRITYEQIFVYAPHKWPYPGTPTYVFTHSKRNRTSHAEFVHNEPAQFVTSLKERVNGVIWVVGGSNLLLGLREHHLIDEYIL